jgi:hypothetical protein
MRRCSVVLSFLFLGVGLAAQPASAYQSCVSASVSGDLLGSTSAGTVQCVPVYNGSVVCQYQTATVGGTDLVVYEQVCVPVVP